MKLLLDGGVFDLSLIDGRQPPVPLALRALVPPLRRVSPPGDLVATDGDDAHHVILNLTPRSLDEFEASVWQWGNGLPPGLEAFSRGQQTMVLRLESDGGILEAMTLKPRWSYAQTLRTITLAMAEFTLKHLRAEGVEHPDLPAPGPAASGRRAGRWRFVVRHVRNAVGVFASRYFSHDVWGIGVAEDASPADVISGRALDLSWLLPGRALSYVADPFVYERDGQTWLIGEAFTESRESSGQLVEARYRPGEPPDWQDAVREPFHLSYPSIARSGGETFLIPEASASRELRMYQLQSDGGWTFLQTLLEDVAVVDPTIFRYEGRWWLFCTRADLLSMELLYAYHSDDLGGPWLEHPLNPLKGDITSARPAGPVFEHSGQLFRPTQNCGATYGGSVKIQEITELSPSTFSERTVRELGPAPDWPMRDGCHHLVFAEGRVILDAKRRVFDPLFFARRLMTRPRV